MIILFLIIQLFLTGMEEDLEQSDQSVTYICIGHVLFSDPKKY